MTGPGTTTPGRAAGAGRHAAGATRAARPHRGLLRQVVYVAGLTAVWLMLWDRVSVANAVAGVIVAIVVLTAFPTRSDESLARKVPVRPLAVARLIVYLTGQIAQSNWQVARAILRRRMHTGIVACPLGTSSPALITLISNILAIAPGTLTVETRADPSTVYLHVLMLRDARAVRASVARLERYVVRAFGTEPIVGPSDGTSP